MTHKIGYIVKNFVVKKLKITNETAIICKFKN